MGCIDGVKVRPYGPRAVEVVSSVLILVNGEKHDVASGITVAGLLEQLKIVAERVAVERNRLVVRRGTYAQTELQDGDEIEILTFVGGG